ncbi:DUF2147 domain-containing protein [Helicobacter cetorum]|uniref:DUF2147 domain-containing protein n=1 Tax=Helicobacter cetorum (strain ATCC BAA-540 / CCUG 52418 / MIT 99-5656) TaxID=1163745 RepID=I0ETF4_HELCM|nr:DUF2147 domain-containing protein [Helicobacter cetorum]AFI06223.1 hypothetical protein HCD_06105 [Helicobacter cetorum MIT 99-5656]
MVTIIIFLAFFGFLGAVELSGIYQTQAFLHMKSSYVEFFKYKGKFYAYGISNVDGSSARKDKYNPNPELRNRSDKGVVFLSGLVKKGDRSYKDGKAYNFYDGKTYYVKVTQNSKGDLEFTPSYDKWGYVGKTFIWKRMSNEQVKALKLKRFNLNEVLKTIQASP